jgi:hypothetical protein
MMILYVLLAALSIVVLLELLSIAFLLGGGIGMSLSNRVLAEKAGLVLTPESEIEVCDPLQFSVFVAASGLSEFQENIERILLAGHRGGDN